MSGNATLNERTVTMLENY